MLAHVLVCRGAPLTKAQALILKQFIDDEYRVNMILDNLPAAVRVDPGLRRQAKKMLASKQTFGPKGEFTPLEWFADKGDLDTCTALLACGAAVDEIDSAGLTPFHLACEKGHEAARRARGHVSPSARQGHPVPSSCARHNARHSEGEEDVGWPAIVAARVAQGARRRLLRTRSWKD